MVKGSFVLSAHLPKTQAQKRQIAFRDTKIRYLVIVLAIFVIFVMEYCFDNPSVQNLRI
jgi:zona occludens toxin (predicted ATPase)